MVRVATVGAPTVHVASALVTVTKPGFALFEVCGAVHPAVAGMVSVTADPVGKSVAAGAVNVNASEFADEAATTDAGVTLIVPAPFVAGGAVMLKTALVAPVSGG